MYGEYPPGSCSFDRRGITETKPDISPRYRSTLATHHMSDFCVGVQRDLVVEEVLEEVSVHRNVARDNYG